MWNTKVIEFVHIGRINENGLCMYFKNLRLNDFLIINSQITEVFCPYGIAIGIGVFRVLVADQFLDRKWLNRGFESSSPTLGAFPGR